MQNKRTLIFTGGHHTGSLAVAKQLITNGWQIIWFGHRHSMREDKSDSAEYQEVSAAGIPFYSLMAGKFYRTYNPLKLLRLPFGFIHAAVLLLYFKVTLGKSLRGIVSSGGYLAVPVVVMGWLLRIPSITHEQTVISGWANRLISKFSRTIAITWPSSITLFPKSKTILTGLPIRQEIKHLSNKPTRPPTILVMGGKQGSHLINQIIFDSLLQLLEKYKVIHQLGSNSRYQDFLHACKLKKSLPPQLQNRYVPHQYLAAPDLARAYSSCSLVVSRSGAHTVYELVYLNIPSVLIPISWSSHQEQLANARLLVDAQRGILLSESQLSPQNLLTSIGQAFNLSHSKFAPLDLPSDGLPRLVNLIETKFHE